MKFWLWAGVLSGITCATRLAVPREIQDVVAVLEKKDEDNPEGVNITITPWSSFDLLNPGLSSSPGTGAQERIFRIVELPRVGKMPDFHVYDVGTSDARLPRPILFYKHDSKLVGLDVNIKSSADKPLLEWRGYHKTSKRSSVRAFITSPGKGMGKETYHTMTCLSRHGAKKAEEFGKFRRAVESGPGKRPRQFILDSGRCPRNKKSECGKHIYNAQGRKKKMSIFSPESGEVVAHSERMFRTDTQLGWTATYELTVSPGHDPLLLANFACFIASANLVETKRKQSVEKVANLAGQAAFVTGMLVGTPYLGDTSTRVGAILAAAR